MTESADRALVLDEIRALHVAGVEPDSIRARVLEVFRLVDMAIGAADAAIEAAAEPPARRRRKQRRRRRSRAEIAADQAVARPKRAYKRRARTETPTDSAAEAPPKRRGRRPRAPTPAAEPAPAPETAVDRRRRAGPVHPAADIVEHRCLTCGVSFLGPKDVQRCHSHRL